MKIQNILAALPLFSIFACAAQSEPQEPADLSTDVAHVNASAQSEATTPPVELNVEKGKTTGGTSPRPCLKCIGCSVSWGWNACCEVVEVSCKDLPKRQ